MDDEKKLIFCDQQIENGSDCCFTCTKSFINEPWGDIKCEYKNHIVNLIADGYVCKDYKPIGKKIITENLEGGVIDDNA